MPKVKKLVPKTFPNSFSIDLEVRQQCSKSVVVTILRFIFPLNVFHSKSRRPLCTDGIQISAQVTAILSLISGNVKIYVPHI